MAKSKLDIHPTHTCFDDALDLLCDLIKEDPSRTHSNELVLVHAICVAPDLGEYAHAWLEQRGEHVLWFGILEGERSLFRSDVAGYYEKFGVVETTKYTVREAWQENYRHSNYGPWNEKYRRLCKNVQR